MTAERGFIVVDNHFRSSDPQVFAIGDAAACASQCASCGACRDCGLC
ncbi:MAG: FAD-dependent oxidoreductase [Deltaproteobacteria bacterium]|nr:FAD-dependent oxidoreductase [Deltaproteobacteria bacterium]